MSVVVVGDETGEGCQEHDIHEQIGHPDPHPVGSPSNQAVGIT